MSMSRRLGCGLVEVRVGEAGLDMLQKPVERRCVRDVGGNWSFLCLAGTTGEVTPNTSLAINEYGAGVSSPGPRCQGR